MSEMKFCPDCTLKMDVLETQGGEYHICGNRKCVAYVDLFDRYEDKRMDALDMEQEMRKGMDDE